MTNFLTLGNKPNEADHVLAYSCGQFNHIQGTEYLEHYVVFAYEDGEPVGEKYVKCSSADDADSFGEKLADHHDLPFETDLIWE